MITGEVSLLDVVGKVLAKVLQKRLQEASRDSVRFLGREKLLMQI